jgi:hypothetical protein
MRTITLIKMINCNNWAPHSNNDCWTARNKLSIPIPITDPPILPNGDNLYYLWFYRYYHESMGLGAYIPELDKLHVPIDLFYYRLAYLLYNFLGEGDYFYEDD